MAEPDRPKFPEITEPEVEVFDPEDDSGFLETQALAPALNGAAPHPSPDSDDFWEQELELTQDASSKPWVTADLEVDPLGDGPFPAESDSELSTLDKMQSVLRDTNGFSMSRPALPLVDRSRFGTALAPVSPQATIPKDRLGSLVRDPISTDAKPADSASSASFASHPIYRPTEVFVRRRRGSVEPKAEAEAASTLRRTSTPRHYPKMQALLQEPPRERQVVLGSFIPRPPPPPKRPELDLEQLLSAMADGLLVGEAPGGGTELRVALRDEFFAGTELRVLCVDGTTKAILHAPNHTVARQLEKRREDLQLRLSELGLYQSSVEVKLSDS